MWSFLHVTSFYLFLRNTCNKLFSNGTWVSGYAKAIGHTTSVAAKLWAIWDGINLYIELNLTNVLIELDAKIVVDLLLKE